MYRRRLNDAGYVIYELARTNNRGDGLLTALHRQHFDVLNYKELLFHDFGDRVAQLLHVDLVTDISTNDDNNLKMEALIVNTHLLFPHNSGCCLHRLQQVYKILQFIESYCEEYQLPPLPIILCGDWNGSKNGHVYKFLRSQGFVSSYDIAHHYADDDLDSPKWVSHRNHRGNICGVDFIWLLNPNNPRKPLKESFMEAVLGNIKNHLSKTSIESTGHLQLKTKFTYSSHITYNQFCQALVELGLTSEFHDGLSAEKIKDMWDYVDTDGDGVIDLAHFDIVLNSPSYQQRDDDSNEDTDIQRETWPDKSRISTTLGFDVKNAVLFPPEVEQGNWPESYSLSDHAHLTVAFAPTMLFIT
ncbi:poly(A)-specific ribonuclease [Ranunculus cassubicifolius]